MQAGRSGWRRVSEVMFDRRTAAKVKWKDYEMVVRPAMMFGLETVSLSKRQEASGVTWMDRIRKSICERQLRLNSLGIK